MVSLTRLEHAPPTLILTYYQPTSTGPSSTGPNQQGSPVTVTSGGNSGQSTVHTN